MNMNEVFDNEKDQKLIANMELLIDPTNFKTVVDYFYNNSTEINQVVSVQKKENLGKVAAVLTGLNNSNKCIEIFEKFLDEGIVKYSVPDLYGVVKKRRHCAFQFTEVPDNQLCWVIQLPPIYVIYIDDKKFE